MATDIVYGADDIVLLDELGRGANLRRAALVLGLSRSTLSRRLAALEEKIGEDIFLRRGKRLVPSQLGAELLARASAPRRALEAFTTTAAEGSAASKSRLTVAVAPLFAEIVMPAVLERFHRRRAGVRVELRLSHDRAALFEDPIDLALRRGPLPDSDSLVARRLGRTTLVVVGPPAGAWLPRPAARGAIFVEWVQTLPWIKVGARLVPMEIELRSRPLARAVVMPTFAVDSQRVALDLVRRGVGIARVNLFRVRDELASGALQEVLPEARSTEDVFAVHPRRRRPGAALRDFLADLVATTKELGDLDESPVPAPSIRRA